MPTLKDVLAGQIPGLRACIADLVREHGEQVISEITVKQVFGGLQGVRALVCSTSCVDPRSGLSIRGIPIAELKDRLPEEVFWLLLTGLLPSRKEREGLLKELQGRAGLPPHVVRAVSALPKKAPAMNLMVSGLLAMEEGSVFRRRLEAGIPPEEQWEAALEDGLDLMARLPALVGLIYRKKYADGKPRGARFTPDWTAGLVRMMGLRSEAFMAMLRRYLVLHADHEGGDLSAFTAHVVGSGLADPYFAVAAGLCGLAAPLHGRESAEATRFHLAAHARFDGPPTAAQMTSFAREWLAEQGRIPGYGHPVLEVVDPRFRVMHAYGKKNCPGDALYTTMDVGSRVIPEVLRAAGQPVRRWPTVDAAAGCMLHHFGLNDPDFYPVLMGTSRAMGLIAHLVLCRAVGTPPAGPRSVTLEWVSTCMAATEIALTPGD
jgi:citrate synthase